MDEPSREQQTAALLLMRGQPLPLHIIAALMQQGVDLAAFITKHEN